MGIEPVILNNLVDGPCLRFRNFSPYFFFTYKNNLTFLLFISAIVMDDQDQHEDFNAENVVIIEGHDRESVA